MHDGAGSRSGTRSTLLCAPRPVGQLQELREGPHKSERAAEWQENLVRSRAEAQVALTTDTSFLEKHLIFTADFQQTEDGLLAESNGRFAD